MQLYELTTKTMCIFNRTFLMTLFFLVASSINLIAQKVYSVQFDIPRKQGHSFRAKEDR